MSKELTINKMKALPVKSILQTVCVALVLLSSTAHAIVNVEQAVIGKPPESVHTQMDLLASGASGNTDTSSTRANFLGLWQHGDHTENLQLQYAYGKSGGQVDTDNAFAHLRHRTAISPDWAVEVFAQIGRYPFARLTQRTLFGGGMR